MTADHKVVMSFFALVPILIPLPFLLLGLLVCLIQAVVFCTLAMVYIGMSLSTRNTEPRLSSRSPARAAAAR